MEIVFDSSKNSETVGEKPRIAIPEPCSYDPEYSGRALPPYLRAIKAAGGEPVVVPLQSSPEEIARIITSCAAILLPGSKADVDPQKFNAADASQNRACRPAPGCRRRTAASGCLQPAQAGLRHLLWLAVAQRLAHGFAGAAYRVQRKPQSGRESRSRTQGDCGSDSLLAKEILHGKNVAQVPVNSSHHQSADVIGDGLRAVAHCAEDGVIEAIEGTVPGHYVCGSAMASGADV